MWQFEFIQGSLSPTSTLGITATKLVQKFNESKKLRAFKRELSPMERLKLNEVTVRETPSEEIEKRWNELKNGIEAQIKTERV